MRCPACRFVFVQPAPRPEDLAAYYQAGYLQGPYRALADTETFRRATLERRLRELQRYTPRGRLLDVGCSRGAFLRVAQRAGWDVYGVELSREAASHAQAAFGERVHAGTLATAPFHPQSFDLITMFDLIEHCGDPLAELRAARDLLKPDGVLALTTPNITSLPAKLTGRWYAYIRPPDHLTYFSPKTIARALQAARLTLLVVQRAPKSFSIEHAITLLPHFYPALARWARFVREGMPTRLRSWSLSLYLGEMLVVARRVETGTPHAKIHDRALPPLP